MEKYLVSADQIASAISAKFSVFDLSQQCIADLQYGLVEASLRGIDTHGVRLTDCYLKELAGGRSNCKPEMSYHSVLPAATTLNADNGLGIHAGMTAMRKAMSMAEKQGIAAVAVKNSNHFGAASVYSLAAARNGFIGIALSNADALIAPFNGKTPMFGTNPISVAAPAANGETFCLDMACSQVAYSKVRHIIAHGGSVPADWMHPGKTEHEAGPLKPLGGYKGMGLALMVQVLTNALTGTFPDHHMSHLYDEPFDTPRQVAHLMLAINIESFADTALFEQYLSNLMNDVRQSAPEHEHLRVICPGDKESEICLQRTEEGIPLSQSEFETLFHYT